MSDPDSRERVPGDPALRPLSGGKLLSEINNRLVSCIRQHYGRGPLKANRYSEMIEELNGRNVLAFLSQTHVDPDLTIEMFLMDGPLPGLGVLELVDGERLPA